MLTKLFFAIKVDIMNDIIAVQKNLNNRFVYINDMKDSWNILTKEGKIVGDCEDYILTLMYILSSKSCLKMSLSILSMKFVIWYCKSPGGENHVVLWIRGIGWTDNINGKIVKKEDLKKQGYKLYYPMLAPVVAAKMILK
jgi:predicted transglutaminase-like cysteine proteinase